MPMTVFLGDHNCLFLLALFSPTRVHGSHDDMPRTQLLTPITAFASRTQNQELDFYSTSSMSKVPCNEFRNAFPNLCLGLVTKQ